MLDVKYHKDYRHNYLIIKCEAQYGKNTYQRKMITTNSIRGLLGCQERHVNGDTLLYYEITSRQSLESLYAVKSIGWDLLRQFFLQLKLVNDMLQKYLLDERGLVLRAEYIFFNMDTNDISFLYYPEAEEDNFAELMDFFISKVDGEDARAVEIIYRIADLVHREHFVLDEVLQWFQDSEEKQETQNVNHDWGNMVPPVTDYGFSAQENQEEVYIDDGMDDRRNRIFDDQRNRAVIPLSIGILIVAVLLYLMYGYRMSGIGKILLAAGWVVAALLIVGALYGYFKGTALMGKMTGSFKVQKKNVEQFAGAGKIQPSGYVSPFAYDLPKQPQEECGNTVFIPWMDGCENRLYGMDKGNKYHIDLNSLPLIVGKMAGAVDMVISEQSISRMHAKFVRIGNNICITDLNSTNGTFKNGLRLSPNASEIIEPGDEIRLGKLKFIYR